MLNVHLAGVGVAGAGLDGWAATRAILTGAEPYVPADLKRYSPAIIPATERRRSSPTIQFAIQVAQEASTAAGIAPAALGSVFACANGDPQTIHTICEALTAAAPMVSPTRFHNSVHNAPAGYWSIATGSLHSANAIATHDASFAAGLLAAAQVAVEGQPMLLVAYDLPFPDPLHEKRPLAAPFALALVLTADRGAANHRITLHVVAGRHHVQLDPPPALPRFSLMICSPCLRASWPLWS